MGIPQAKAVPRPDSEHENGCWRDAEDVEATEFEDHSYQSPILRLRQEKLSEVRDRRPADPTAAARAAPDAPEEVARLKNLLEQARERLAQSERATEQWRNRELEYENLLEEKSEVIRQLHQQLQEFQESPGPSPAAARGAPTEEELIALQEELEREREQLKLDEQSLMAQMRDMEVQMSRERADLARQRSELQRLHNELKHELEIASRDAALRERLAPLYRLQEELQKRRPGSDSGSRPRPMPHESCAAPEAAGAAAPQPAAAQPSSAPEERGGFFRRIFSGK